MFLLPPVEIFFGKIGKIVRLNFYSLLCTDGKIILIILSSGNTRYLSYIGMNHDWWLIDHEWWFVVSDCDCDCPECPESGTFGTKTFIHCETIDIERLI